MPKDGKHSSNTSVYYRHLSITLVFIIGLPLSALLLQISSTAFQIYSKRLLNTTLTTRPYNAGWGQLHGPNEVVMLYHTSKSRSILIVSLIVFLDLPLPLAIGYPTLDLISLQWNLHVCSTYPQTTYV